MAITCGSVSVSLGSLYGFWCRCSCGYTYRTEAIRIPLAGYFSSCMDSLLCSEWRSYSASTSIAGTGIKWKFLVAGLQRWRGSLPIFDLQWCVSLVRSAWTNSGIVLRFFLSALMTTQALSWQMYCLVNNKKPHSTMHYILKTFIHYTLLTLEM